MSPAAVGAAAELSSRAKLSDSASGPGEPSGWSLWEGERVVCHPRAAGTACQLPWWSQESGSTRAALLGDCGAERRQVWGSCPQQCAYPLSPR